MILFHDWEFLENGSTIAPISVGMVREDGESYYAVFADAPWWAVQQHSWLFKNVWPRTSLDGRGPAENGATYFKSKMEIALEVLHFIEETPDVELWGDYCSYDHVALCQLWGTMMSLPVTVPMFTSDLQTELRRARLSEEMLPARPAIMIEHNALGDARYELLCWKFVREFDAEASYVERKHLLAAAVEGWWKPKGE
jgi:hypothetical protein